MALTEITLALTPETNPLLSILSARYKDLPLVNGRRVLPNSALPRELAEPLKVLYRDFFGTELPDDDYTIAILEKEGAYYRTLIPMIALDGEGNPVIVWGSNIAPLEYDFYAKQSRIYPQHAAKDAYDVEFDFVSFGIGEDPALRVSTDYADSVLTTYFPLFRKPDQRKNWEDVGKAAVNRMVKAGQPLDTLISVFGGSGEVSKLYDLPLGTYKVTNATCVERDFGMSSTLTLDNGQAVYGNRSITSVLTGTPKPIISASKPATLTILKIEGKRVTTAFEPADYEEYTGHGINFGLLSQTQGAKGVDFDSLLPH